MDRFDSTLLRVWAATQSSGGVNVTGVATVALALVTVVLVFAAMCQARLVREQVEDARKPVVVPGGHDTSAVPHRSGGGLLLPVANVGMAPALEVAGEVWVAGQSQRVSARRPIAGLPAGATGELVFQASFDRDVSFGLEITTRDTARALHKTSALWDPQHGFAQVITQSPKGKGSR